LRLQQGKSAPAQRLYNDNFPPKTFLEKGLTKVSAHGIILAIHRAKALKEDHPDEKIDLLFDGAHDARTVCRNGG